MGLFDKKYCDICGAKIGLLGNRKLEDGNLCKNCAAKLSPWFSDRRQSTVAEIGEQLSYREANREKVSAFRTTRTLGERTKVLLDEDAGLFMVTAARNLEEANPDVMAFSDVTGCKLDIEESRTEIEYKDAEGCVFLRFLHRDPCQQPLFQRDSLPAERFRGGQRRGNAAGWAGCPAHLPRGAAGKSRRYARRLCFQCRGSARQRRIPPVRGNGPGDTGCTASGTAAGAGGSGRLLQVRQQVREEAAAAAAPKAAVTCPYCGATTTPDASGCCEYCGGAVNS